MKKLTLLLGCLLSFSSLAVTYVSYMIEIAHNDEVFIINGERYKAKTYCFGFEEGDEVIFLDGNAYGTCVAATIFNLRTKKNCELWCD